MGDIHECIGTLLFTVPNHDINQFKKNFEETKSYEHRIELKTELNYSYPVDRDEFLFKVQRLSDDIYKELVDMARRRFPVHFQVGASDVSPAEQFEAAAAPLMPAIAPALWRNRPPGRGTNPAQWILDHYGNQSGERASWEAGGLTRADIKRLDPDLYVAFAQWVKNGRGHEEDAALVPARPHTRYTDADGTIEKAPFLSVDRMSAAELASVRKYKALKGRKYRLSK